MYHVSVQGVDERMINVHYIIMLKILFLTHIPPKTVAPTEVKKKIQIGYGPEIQGKQHGKEPWIFKTATSLILNIKYMSRDQCQKKRPSITHQRQRPAEFQRRIVGWCSSAARVSHPAVTALEACSAPEQAPFPSSPWHWCCLLSVQKQEANTGTSCNDLNQLTLKTWILLLDYIVFIIFKHNTMALI